MFRYITRKFTNKQILIKPKLIKKSISDLNTKFYNMNTNNKKSISDLNTKIDNMNITTNKNSSVITDIKSTAIVFCTTIIISLTVCLTVFSK